MNLRCSRWLKKFSYFEKRVDELSNVIFYGRIVSVNGLILKAVGLKIPIGARCFIERIINGHDINIEAEVIGLLKKEIILLSFEDTNGVVSGARVFSKLGSNTQYVLNKIPLGMKLLGRVLDGIGHPLDGRPIPHLKYYSKIYNHSINPLKRRPITNVLDTGIRSINGLLTIGIGQRIGLFSSSGVGKSILLGMIAKYTKSDVVVIALIGERGREVKDFIENILGSEGSSRSVIIAAPADASPLKRVEGASYATSIAEYFRSKNKHVLLIMDSLTRYAMAQREISLALNEFPVSKGYPPSIFSKIPDLLERTGNTYHENGSITAFYTILTESEEDHQDPVSYLARSILDGHIILSRQYSDAGHYPAIDIESSISRIMPDIVNVKQYSQACHFKKLVSAYQRNKDLIHVGAYINGTNPILDQAIRIWPKIEKFLQQEKSEKSDYSTACKELNEIFI
ncbi:FliI/YscN family ATPase [Buchnera aphidicola (Muscaphis stroyani)]|uniref:Flagellum-specific ATP synthase n=2 Tax=Buchnera aphidicola TaxID=9 RepID=A0A4D6YFH5_9GAMM|nr:FliI/YscN family ATPase [Buchnera aphidicola (Muscaphis stroyani)]